MDVHARKKLNFSQVEQVNDIGCPSSASTTISHSSLAEYAVIADITLDLLFSTGATRSRESLPEIHET
jgi:hypothetical protein